MFDHAVSESSRSLHLSDTPVATGDLATRGSSPTLILHSSNPVRFIVHVLSPQPLNLRCLNWTKFVQ